MSVLPVDPHVRFWSVLGRRKPGSNALQPLLGIAVALTATGVALAEYLPASSAPVLTPLAFLAGAVAAHRFRGKMPASASIPAAMAPRAESVIMPPTRLDAPVMEPAAPDRCQPLMDRARAELDDYPVFTGILCSQMGSIVSLSETAASKIMTGLSTVDTQLGALVGFIQTSGSNEHVSQVSDEIAAQIGGCQALLGDFVRHQMEESEDVALMRRRLEGETRSVTETLEGIGSIARQTTMLSINVSIQAARAGDVGKGFMVIGNEIRMLAEEVRGLAAEINTRLETLTRTVNVDFQERADRREAVQRKSIDSIVAKLESLTENVTVLLAHQRDCLQKVEAENEAIAGPILEIMGSIQFQDITRQQIEQLQSTAQTVDAHIAEIAAMLRNARDLGDMQSLAEKLDGLFASYVMDSQRTAHRSAAGADNAQGPAATPMIELF